MFTPSFTLYEFEEYSNFVRRGFSAGRPIVSFLKFQESVSLLFVFDWLLSLKKSPLSKSHHLTNYRRRAALHKSSQNKAGNRGGSRFLGKPDYGQVPFSTFSTKKKFSWATQNLYIRQRPYRNEYTGSLPNSEVNRCRARSVLNWGTVREHPWVPLAIFSTDNERC